MPSPILRVRNLKKRFGRIEALKGVNLQVKKGEILGLIGPNGSGKTTMFNLIMGKFKQDSGNILFKGEEISNLKTYERVNRGLARTFQVPKFLQSFSVIENIRLYNLPNSVFDIGLRGKVNMESSERNGEKLDLKNDFWKPPSLLPIEGVRKLELAKAISTKPELLLVDEVVAGMTSEESKGICDILTQLNREGMSILLIDHNLSVLKTVVERFVVIDAGKKIAEGNAEEISTNEKVVEAYIGTEL